MTVPTKEKTRSLGATILERLEDFADALERNEPLEERFTCRTMAMPAPSPKLSSQDVKNIRKSLKASQSIFGRFLGVSLKTVQSWEQGLSQPSEIACRFLAEIRFNPPYWTLRLKQLAKSEPA